MTNEVVNVDEKKEIIELLNGIEPVAIAGVKIGADGKINFSDLKHVGELLGSFGVIKDGVEGLKGMKLKELEGEDLQVIGKAAYEMVKRVIEAYKNEKE